MRQVEKFNKTKHWARASLKKPANERHGAQKYTLKHSWTLTGTPFSMQGWNIWSGLSKRHQLIHKLTCSPAHIPHCLTKILRVSKLIWHVTPSLNLRRNFHETYDFPPSDFNYISATYGGPGFVTCVAFYTFIAWVWGKN